MALIESLLRRSAGLAANTTAVQAWATALSQVADGASISQSTVVGLFRNTGIPIGSAFGQFGMQASLAVLPAVAGYSQLNALERQLDQKLPGGDLAWAEGVAGRLGAPVI